MAALNCQVVLNPESRGRVSRAWIGVEDKEFGCKLVPWSAMFRSSQVCRSDSSKPKRGPDAIGSCPQKVGKMCLIR
jgi:hypothetical protein